MVESTRGGSADQIPKAKRPAVTCMGPGMLRGIMWFLGTCGLGGPIRTPKDFAGIAPGPKSSIPIPDPGAGAIPPPDIGVCAGADIDYAHSKHTSKQISFHLDPPHIKSAGERGASA